MRKVAILCAAKKTAYRDIPDLEIYDEVRDARTFQGGMPVIAHPPCRRWTRFGMAMLAGAKTKYQNHVPPSKEEIESERELGIWCALQVKCNGGILEQPAHSGLWDAAKLPKPGWTATADLWAMQVWQAWWGFPTWLLFSGINPHSLRLHLRGGDKYAFEHMPGGNHPYQRAMTVPALAQWLVDLARTANIALDTCVK